MVEKNLKKRKISKEWSDGENMLSKWNSSQPSVITYMRKELEKV